jgi:hypothetical protein
LNSDPGAAVLLCLLPAPATALLQSGLVLLLIAGGSLYPPIFF